MSPLVGLSWRDCRGKEAWAHSPVGIQGWELVNTREALVTHKGRETADNVACRLDGCPVAEEHPFGEKPFPGSSPSLEA